MQQLISEYQKSKDLSKNYSSRSNEESSQLYATIQEAVSIVQFYQDKDSGGEESLQFLTAVFEPLLKKTAGFVHKFVYKHEDFNDVLQETYLKFIELTYQYDPAISQFSYYVKTMLTKQMRAWSKKQKRHVPASVDIAIINNLLVDHSLCDVDTVYMQFNELILIEEFNDFIEDRACKKARSSTVKEVCYKYFLGTHSCKQIAEELQISYHAVYEVIKRIEKEYKVFLEQDSIIGY